MFKLTMGSLTDNLRYSIINPLVLLVNTLNEGSVYPEVTERNIIDSLVYIRDEATSLQAMCLNYVHMEWQGKTYYECLSCFKMGEMPKDGHEPNFCEHCGASLYLGAVEYVTRAQMQERDNQDIDQETSIVAINNAALNYEMQKDLHLLGTLNDLINDKRV